MRMSLMIEVFDSRNGNPIVRVRWQWVARIIIRLNGWWDYNQEGKGWVDGR